VMENVLFKVSYPAEFHAQTAVELRWPCTSGLRSWASQRKTFARSRFAPTKPACASSIKRGRSRIPPIATIACIYDRDSADLRRLTAADYEDEIAADPRVDVLRAKMKCVEEPAFTADYHDPEKRSIANSLRLELADRTVVEETVEYPIGHRRRRDEGLPLLVEKFKTNLRRRYAEDRQEDSGCFAGPGAAGSDAGK